MHVISPPRPLLFAALLFAACAGDDGESAGDDGESSTTSASTSQGTTGAETDGTSTSGADSSGSTGTSSEATSTGGSSGSTTSSTGDASTSTGDNTTGVDPDQIPPVDSVDALLAWLEGESYTSWHAESGIHASAGPHGGQVRTFINDALFDSLDQGQSAHPAGATAIKELWGDGQMRIGWAVEVKVQPESAGGNGWYWYEKIDMTEYGGDLGVGLCTGCHGGGIDYVLTPFPLQ
ncbi:MAG: hypothetical protein H6710_21655 [Myxococcales bacterium]|nr:hypothetical protein [Myxococcales bacterium]MCB9701741.1 hypothetical protein [Myxococcales bacterium]